LSGAAKSIPFVLLKSNEKRRISEAWYERRLKEGVQVFISHPRLVETGLDLWFAPTIISYESGYSLHTLRQPEIVADWAAAAGTGEVPAL
jgi:hypothetical protein